MGTAQIKKLINDFSNENLHVIEISQVQLAERIYHQTGWKLALKKQGYEEAEIKKSNKMYILGPYLDESGIIIVKGRLDKSNLRNKCKHFIMISNDSPISKLIIRWCHTKLVMHGEL